MSKSDTYAQCSMSRTLSTGAIQRHVAWIPNEFAKPGHVIDIKMVTRAKMLYPPDSPATEYEEWTRGWIVESVGNKKDWSDLELKSRDYLRQRKASDI